MRREISGADISVIIPVYNRAAQLSATLDCIFQQTLPPGEVVVVDDGSSDDPEAIIRAYNEPRVRFQRQANGGPGKARNTALALAHGRIAAFLDSDDRWLPTKLEQQVAHWNRLVRAGKDCVLLDTFVARSSQGGIDWCRKMVKKGVSFDELVVKNTINGTSSVICERELVLQAGGFPESYRFAEDRFVWLLLARAGGCYTVPEVLVIKHHDGDNLTENLDLNLQHKSEFMRHVEREFELPKRLRAKMHLWNLAEFLLLYRRRGNYPQSLAMARRLWACDDRYLLLEHPKALLALVWVLSRRLRMPSGRG